MEAPISSLTDYKHISPQSEVREIAAVDCEHLPGDIARIA